MQIARFLIWLKLLWSLTNGIQYVNDECWKISEIHLKRAFMGKLLSNLWGLGPDPDYLWKKKRNDNASTQQFRQIAKTANNQLSCQPNIKGKMKVYY